MANKPDYWRLKLRIHSYHNSFFSATVALYAFLNQFPSAFAYLLAEPLRGRFAVVDKATFFEQRGHMTFSTATIIFYGNVAWLTELASAVPPSLALNIPAQGHDPESAPQED